MEANIKFLTVKKLTGIRLKMSFSDNRTGELWRSFMQRRNEIRNNTGADLFSMQIYDHGFFDNFNPSAMFEKWAAVEVSNFDYIPAGMETFILYGGFYAVFNYHGSAAGGEETFRYIFEKWLPESPFLIDDRPHFELLGEKYRNNNPDSEEEIWIPIKPKYVPYSISPWLTVSDSRKATEFYCSAFGATVVYKLQGDGDDLVTRLSVGGFEFWVSNGSQPFPNSAISEGGGIRMIISVPDPEAFIHGALKDGTTLIYPVREEHGWQTGRIIDPFGIHWEITRQVE